MATYTYHEESNGFGYHVLQNGFGYYEIRDPANPSTPILNFTALDTRVAYLFSVDIAGNLQTFSWNHTHPLINGSMWRPCMTQPLTMTQSINDGVGLIKSRSSRSFGTVEIAINGYDDPLVDLAWEGKPWSFFRTPNSQNPATVERLLIGYIRRAQYTKDRLTLTLTDGSHLMQVPTALDFYAGTGLTQPGNVEEGPAELKGVAKPRAFGFCYNITPVLIDRALNIYQYHTGPSGGVLAVYDKGAALENAGHIPNLGLGTVHAWAPTAQDGGKYVFDLARSYVRLAGPPAGQVTMDVAGDVNTNGTRLLPMMERIHALYGPPEIPFIERDYEEADEVGQEGGIYLGNDNRPRLDVLYDQICASAGAYWMVNNLGWLRVFPLKVEDTPSLIVPASEILREPEPRILRLDQPVHRVTVTYKKNFTLLTNNDILEQQTQEIQTFSAFATLPGLSEVAEDTAVSDANPTSRDVEVDTFAELQPWAATLAQRLLDMNGIDVRIAEFSLHEQLWSCFLGKTLQVDFPGVSIKGLIVEITENVETRRTALKVLGEVVE